jgi:uncharacterized protein (TIGR03435 family)
MDRRLVLYVGVFVAAALAQAPAFEAASIKLSGPRSVRGWEGGPGTRDPGRYSFGQATLPDLIGIAYDVDQNTRISSAVPLDQHRFDLVAKIPEGATKEQFRAMMWALLVERFHLQAHVVSKELPVFDLVVAKGGPKLKESDAADSGQPGISSNFSAQGGFEVVHVRAQRASMELLAKMLPNPGEPPLFDRTGLTGIYDFTLDYTIEQGVSGSAGTPPAPDLAVALRQQLGLQMVGKKAAMDVVVVDSVDKLPTEN